jgi:hypothetical protein
VRKEWLIPLAALTGAASLFVLKNKKKKPPLLQFADADRKIAADAAARMLAAMDRYGTDEEEIFDLSESLTPKQMKLTYQIFGLKPYSGYGQGMPGIDWYKDKIDLFGWFRNELNEAELQKLRSIWEKSEMPITF